MKTALTLAALAALGLTAATAHAANLVSNGGFETGDFTDWTLGGQTDHEGVTGTFNSIAPHTGNYAGFFGQVGGNGTLSQTLSTTAGAAYTVDFWLANDDIPTDYFSVALGSQQLGSLTNVNPFGWTEYSFSGVAQTNADTLTFTFRQDPGYFHLDDVAVYQAGTITPEPASWAALGLGGLALLALARRAKKSA